MDRIMPVEEFLPEDFLEENDMFEDEEALEVLREMESNTQKPDVQSPVRKKPRLEIVSPSVKKNILSDLTNIIEDASDEDDAMETDAYKIPRIGQRKIYKRIPVDGDYQTLTMADGERFYVRLNDENENDKDEEICIEKQSNYTGLCGQPYSELLEQAIEEQLRIQENTSVRKTNEDDSGIDSSEDESLGANLWVDRFRPRSYVNLLSDDGTNRTLLHWLKLWDKVVHGKELPKKPIKVMNEGDQPSKPQFHSNNEVIVELDTSGKKEIFMSYIMRKKTQ